jgi:flagellar hook assembly protein FlgD
MARKRLKFLLFAQLSCSGCFSATPFQSARVTEPGESNGSLSVQRTRPRDARVRIGIYDVRGTLVCTLNDQDYSAGTHTVVWTGEDDSGQAQPSGVYFARLMVDGIQEAVKLTLVR